VKAVMRERYGPPSVLELREVETPSPSDGELLVRVSATSVNPLDWHDLTGWPYLVRVRNGLRRPKERRLGVDFAGTVEAVGGGVTHFLVGDDVFGARNGAFAEYVVVSEDRSVVHKPASVTFEQAAAVPVAAVTALQGLRDRGRLRAGQKVLVNGASGGVGTFAVQIAKAFGAEVTGVCSTRNMELVRSLGADHIVDYTQEDFTRRIERYDLLLDVAGGRSWSDCTRVLTENATVVVAGGPKPNRFTGLSLRHLARLRVASWTGSRKAFPFLAKLNPEDLGVLAELLASGQVVPAIDRRYALDEIADALAYVGEGHARSKVVVTA